MVDIGFSGKYVMRHYRDGVLIDTFEADNIVVTEGINNLLNAGLRNNGAQTAWYIGIYGGAYTPVATETAATIAANAAEITAYSGGARPRWFPAAAVAKSITNAAQPATFTFTGNGTANGAFMVSSSQLSGTGGVLMCVVAFTTSKAFTTGDILTVTYAMTGASV